MPGGSTVVVYFKLRSWREEEFATHRYLGATDPPIDPTHGILTIVPCRSKLWFDQPLRRLNLPVTAPAVRSSEFKRWLVIVPTTMWQLRRSDCNESLKK